MAVTAAVPSLEQIMSREIARAYDEIDGWYEGDDSYDLFRWNDMSGNHIADDRKYQLLIETDGKRESIMLSATTIGRLAAAALSPQVRLKQSNAHDANPSPVRNSMSKREFDYLYSLLKDKYKTQQRMAEALGIDRSYLSKIKTGANKMSYRLARKLYDLTGAKPSSNTMGIPDDQINWVVTGQVWSRS